MLLWCRPAQKTQPSRQRPEHLGDFLDYTLVAGQTFRVGYLSAANDFEGFNSPGFAARFVSNHQVGRISATGGAGSSSFLGLTGRGSVTFEPLPLAGRSARSPSTAAPLHSLSRSTRSVTAASAPTEEVKQNE